MAAAAGVLVVALSFHGCEGWRKVVDLSGTRVAVRAFGVRARGTAWYVLWVLIEYLSRGRLNGDARWGTFVWESLVYTQSCNDQ